MKEYTNSQMKHLVDEHIHSARDRRIMLLHYIDGLSADVISKIDNQGDILREYRIDIEPRSISRILQNRLKEIEKYL